MNKEFDARVKRGYGPWFPKKIPVSEEARDLMARLIETDASKRLSAKEASQHPWILTKGNMHKSQHEDDGCHNLCYYVGSIQFRSAISKFRFWWWKWWNQNNGVTKENAGSGYLW